MGVLAVTGATVTCPFGTKPCTLKPSSQTAVLADSLIAGTIADVNVGPFGMCSSLANPAVATATAAALGVLTPQPCTFAPGGTWTPASPKILAGGKPVLTTDSSIVCAVGAGILSVVSPGQMKVLTN